MRVPFLFFSLLLLSLMAGSCRKGNLPEENYFGRVEVTLVDLPNTPDISVRFNGKVLDDTIAPSTSQIFTLLSQEGKLEIFKTNTDSLLADTLIRIAPNTKQDFRFAYSEEFGLQGFIAGGNVAPDSIRVQFLNNLTDYYNAEPSTNLELWVYDLNTGEIKETGMVINGFSDTKLSTDLTLLNQTSDGSPVYYIGRLKNTATGEYIMQPGMGTDIWFPPVNSGAAYVFNFYDEGGADIVINPIQL